jgi:fatty acid desaturase
MTTFPVFQDDTRVGTSAGWRRYLDYPDWWPVETWHRQHNQLHHSHTGEDTDPDSMERHGRAIARLNTPEFVKRLLVFLLAATWKFTAYAPNAMSLRDPRTKKWLTPDEIDYLTFRHVLRLDDGRVRALWTSCYLPYVAIHFVGIPMLFLPLGRSAVLFVLLNRLSAEVLTNLHGALVIFPSHTADDLYTYAFQPGNKNEFYAMQVMGTANYRTGRESTDYMSMWLNYQIEHHLFPGLPMLTYRELQPRVKHICEKYGIPYVEESVFERARRAISSITGARCPQRLRAFPLAVHRDSSDG